ncbi:uncharacterized protein LOC110857430 [Folsomia candida]|uniref:Uncharacterized protein n=1 Tax=Folsomia candida TaxID=158441 RepID=A0A226DIA0_FOLCA|nr:uncharacterized protein LOC110857430 [Folsomia candida]OXA45275.1 hypothetical protein Fcan01_19992 [Folsomia candida]
MRSAILVALCCCVAVTSAGVVNVSRCDGLGTPVQTRISDCDGYCRFQPGKTYDCEQDFMPSSSILRLNLKVEVCYDVGLCMQIINADLPGTPVGPGFIYTAKFTFVPNDILAGETLEMRAIISRTEGGVYPEICVLCKVDVLPLL